MTAFPLTLLLAAGAGSAGTPAPTAARDTAAPAAADTTSTTADAVAPNAPTAPPTTGRAQPGDRDASSDTSAPVPPGTAEAQARIDEDAARTAARRAEIDALRTQLTTLQAEVATLRDRTALAEEDAAAARDEAAADRAARAQQAEAATRSIRERAQLTGQALQQMDGALRALAAGDASGVDAALATQADALETARLEAGWQRSPQEALQAAQGEAFVVAAREALSRGDLHEARLAPRRAAAATLGARALAQQGEAAQGGASPATTVQPPAQGGDVRAAYPGQ